MSPVPGPNSRVRDESLVEGMRASETVQGLSALVQLTKPGVPRMVVMTTWCGAAMAPGPLRDSGRLGWTLAGTALVVASASALNMYLEGDVDALMARTRNRPIPSGRISPETALWFGVALAL